MKGLTRGIAAITIGCALTAVHAEDLTLRLGGPWTTGSNLHKGMEKFAEVVGPESGERIRAAQKQP